MISVIIPLYNKENYIAKTIKSVLTQTFKDFELIIVDDGSDDNGLAIISAFSDKRITIYSKKNGGVSSARNFGIKKAKFDYIAFLDADDLWESSYLEEMVNLTKQYPKASVYASAYKLQKGSEFNYKEQTLNLYNPQKVPSILVEDYCQAVIKKQISCWTSTVIIKKSVLEKVGSFKENIQIGEDIDLWLRVGLKYNVAYTYKILAIHIEESENNLMRTKMPLDKTFPYWLWYSYSNNKYLYYMATGALINLCNKFIQEKDNKSAKFILRKIELFPISFKLLVKYILLQLKAR